jgi:ATP-dependent DNA helicase RecQ
MRPLLRSLPTGFPARRPQPSAVTAASVSAQPALKQEATFVSIRRVGEAPAEALRRIFGYGDFRLVQQDVIMHVVSGGDAFALMPTGGGKSLCYQIPALVRPGTGVVISPLVALMQDQVDALRQFGINAATLNRSLDSAEYRRVEAMLERGEIDILYIAPERCANPRLHAMLKKCGVSVLAVDEAHAVSQWGHDFRPEYLNVGNFLDQFPGVPRIAVTATADEKTQADVRQRLGLLPAPVFKTSFDRPNITYNVYQRDGKGREQALHFIRSRHAEKSGIIYCATQAGVDDLARWLASKGLNVVPYHAGLDNDTRRANQRRFLREEGIIAVATIAFGMGIDKPNVRFVVHMELSKDLESYYQETGRAGRDGLPSDVLLLYSAQDVMRRERQIDMDEQADQSKKRLWRMRLDAMVSFAESPECRRGVLLRYFGEEYDCQCGNCDRCRNPVERFDGAALVQKVLSAVTRTNERYGTAHLTDILTGHASKKVIEEGHDALPVFGAGRDLSPDAWKSIFRQLLAKRFLEIDSETYGSLKIGKAGRAFLLNKGAVMLVKDFVNVEAIKPGGGRSRTVEGKRDVLPDDRSVLAEALAKKRREVAAEQNVPVYAVFTDATLGDLVSALPMTVADFAHINGIGEAKAAHYGETFVAIIRDHQAATRKSVPTLMSIAF